MVHTIDVHSHWYPEWYLELLRERDEIPMISGQDDARRFVIFPDEHDEDGRPMGSEYWDIGDKIVFMDQNEISQTVVSLGNPWLDPFAAQGVELARRANRDFAALAERTANRVVGMGVLPGDDVAQAAEVAQEISDTPGLYGIIVGPRICGRQLDDTTLAPLWAVLEDTRMPILLHPTRGLGHEDMAGFGHPFPVGMGFPFETTVALARMIFAGVLQDFPGLRVVASHGGGTLPYLIGRLDAAWNSDPAARQRLKVPPSKEAAKLHLDAICYDRRVMQLASELVGQEQLHFGTDHPFSIADPRRNLEAIRGTFGADGFGRITRASQELFRLPSVD